jgi:hypothetical protein
MLVYSISLVSYIRHPSTAESLPQERSYYRQQGLDVNFVLMPAAIVSTKDRMVCSRKELTAEAQSTRR